MLRVLVVSPNPVVRAGLTTLFGARAGLRVVGVVAEPPDARETVTTARRTAPDLILLDSATAPRDLTAAAPVLLLTHPGAGVPEGVPHLVHGAFTVAELLRVMRATAHGGGSSTVSNILRFRNPASQMQPSVGRFGLSAREAEVMDLIASGMTNQQIAASCSITEKTVKNHINRIFAKLDSATRGEAIASWLGTRTAS
ncbi:response regulator transcription factor [Streptomyces sp. NPDC048659]|uniref:response regulator transcription factor n=1 Tax=Streptomyces sp. NPDC048659 TaxID=3155489 RepID=UPI0034359D56